MYRPAATVAVCLLVVSLASGCALLQPSSTKHIEVLLDVTGAGAETVTYLITGDDSGTGQPTTDDHPALPWHSGLVPEVSKTGSVTLTVVPQGGDVTCKITISKKVATKKTGKPGTPLVCTAELK